MHTYLFTVYLYNIHVYTAHLRLLICLLKIHVHVYVSAHELSGPSPHVTYARLPVDAASWSGVEAV